MNSNTALSILRDIDAHSGKTRVTARVSDDHRENGIILDARIDALGDVLFDLVLDEGGHACDYPAWDVELIV